MLGILHDGVQFSHRGPTLVRGGVRRIVVAHHRRPDLPSMVVAGQDQDGVETAYQADATAVEFADFHKV